MYLAEVNQSFNLTLVEYNNFEAGEGKTVLDTHFAHISHKIVRWVRVGNNLQSGEQLGELIGVIASTIGYYKILHVYTMLWSFLIEITSNHPFKDAFNGLIFIKHLQQTDMCSMLHYINFNFVRVLVVFF